MSEEREAGGSSKANETTTEGEARDADEEDKKK